MTAPAEYLTQEWWWGNLRPLMQTALDKELGQNNGERQVAPPTSYGVEKDWMALFLFTLQMLGGTSFTHEDFKALRVTFHEWFKERLETILHDEHLVRAHAHAT